jgi:hemoglobin/transferrin/lactoferrin receptor protein
LLLYSLSLLAPAAGFAQPVVPVSSTSSTDTASTDAQSTESTDAPEVARADADAEVIVVEQRWPGVDLIDAEHTSRATTVIVPSQDRAAAVLGDHLVGVAGVSVQRTGPGQGVPIVRGLIGSAVLVLVDGIRLNNAIFRPAPNQYTSLVDPWRINAITVLKGPGSAPFGSDALGGVVDISTPLPQFSSPAWSARSEVIAGVSSADQAAVGHASFAAGRQRAGISGSVTIEDHGDIQSGNGIDQAPSDYRAYGAQLVGHLQTGRNDTTAWLQYYEQPELPRTDELRRGFGQDEAAAEVWAYRPSRRIFGHVRELIRDVSVLDGLELHAAYQRIDDDRRTRDTGASEELREQISDHSFTGLVRGTGTAGAMNLLGGVEGIYDYVECGRQTLDLTTGMSEAARCRFPDGSTMTQIGGFSEARRDWFDRLSVRAGLRGGLSSLRIAGDADTRARITTVDWAAELGLELRASSSLSLLANLGRGFRAPNVNDLAGLGPRPGNRFQEPADSLANEHATGADVGVRVRRDQISADAYLFGLRHSDRIDVVPTGAMTDSGREIVVSDNVGTTTTYGAEFSATLHPSPALMLITALTWIRGNKDDTGDGDEPADRIPPLGGSLTARFTPAPRLTLEGGVRFAGAQRRLSARDKDDSRIDPLGTDSFLTLAIGARYAWPSVAVSARLENLTDRQYREHASGVDAPGIDGRILVQWTRAY